MLEYLKLRNVGPAPELEMRFGPRLNLITGDNGLGKSFLLMSHGGRSPAGGRRR
jgi:DNA repair ATPase RecN